MRDVFLGPPIFLNVPCFAFRNKNPPRNNPWRFRIFLCSPLTSSDATAQSYGRVAEDSRRKSLSAPNPKNFFSLKQILLLSELFPRKNFLIWLKPRFSMPYWMRRLSRPPPSNGRSGTSRSCDVNLRTQAKRSRVILWSKSAWTPFLDKFHSAKVTVRPHFIMSSSEADSEMSYNDFTI